MSDKTYADLIALCQFLPGPASSQVGIAIGILRGGLLGGIISIIDFTLPSIIVLIIFALLNVWKTPAWLLVIIGVLGGYVFSLLGF